MIKLTGLNKEEVEAISKQIADAILAALFYAINIPCSKQLLNTVQRP